jgi:putative glutamine amidotransferase
MNELHASKANTHRLPPLLGKLAMMAWSWVLVGPWAGCQTSNHPESTSHPNMPDTLVVVASRLWESRTYQDFLAPLASPDVVRWINASNLTGDSLSVALEEADGILLTGGADIHPARYLQDADTTRCGTIDVDRDSLEVLLLQWVDGHRIPCLGICRGMQFMNVYAGGSLHPHLPDVLNTNAHRAGHAEDSRDTLHVVQATRSWGSVVQGSQSEVVSHHHQGVNRLAEGLEVWAVAPDGLVEGIRARDTMAFPFYVGVQWHPERSATGQPLVDRIGSAFVAAMKSRGESPEP